MSSSLTTNSNFEEEFNRRMQLLQVEDEPADRVLTRQLPKEKFMLLKSARKTFKELLGSLKLAESKDSVELLKSNKKFQDLVKSLKPVDDYFQSNNLSVSGERDKHHDNSALNSNWQAMKDKQKVEKATRIGSLYYREWNKEPGLEKQSESLSDISKSKLWKKIENVEIKAAFLWGTIKESPKIVKMYTIDEDFLKFLDEISEDSNLTNMKKDLDKLMNSYVNSLQSKKRQSNLRRKIE